MIRRSQGYDDPDLSICEPGERERSIRISASAVDRKDLILAMLVVQMVKSDLGNSFDVLIERVGRIKCVTESLDSETLRNYTVVKSYPHLIKVVSLSSRANDQHLSFIRI